MRNVALGYITHFVFYYSIDQSNINYQINNYTKNQFLEQKTSALKFHYSLVSSCLSAC